MPSAARCGPVVEARQRHGLDGRVTMRDQTALACGLHYAVAEHFHRITILTGQVSKYGDHRPFGALLNG
jgi:hypothetical protein